MLDMLPNWIGRSMEDDKFVTNPALMNKVQGKILRPYHGNTIVMDLDDTTKEQLAKAQDRLYAAAGDMLAERLEPKYLHMTVHDLIHGPRVEKLVKDLFAIKPIAMQLTEQLKKRFPEDLNMVTTARFNMAHTSIVQGLMPEDEESWEQLDTMYEAFQRMDARVYLPHAMTPHITLAYFKPGIYHDAAMLAALRQELGHWEHAPIRLKMQDLHYAEFCDMNAYNLL